MNAILLVGVLVCSQATGDKPPSVRFASELHEGELPKDESGQITLMDHALKARLGKFLLIKHRQRHIALRMLRHKQHVTASGKSVAGAIVEYFLSTPGRDLADSQRAEVQVAEDYENQKYLYVHIPQLRMGWSSPDWFYAPDDTGERITVAQTDRDSVDKVDFADAGLTWFYLQCERERAKGPSGRAVPGERSVVTGEGLVLVLTVFDEKVPVGGAARVRLTIENRGPQRATVIMPPDIRRRRGWWGLGAYRFEIKGPTGSFRYVSGGQVPLGVPGPGRPETVTLRAGQSVGALLDVGVAAAETWDKAAGPNGLLLNQTRGKYKIVASYEPTKTHFSDSASELPLAGGKIKSNRVKLEVTDK